MSTSPLKTTTSLRKRQPKTFVCRLDKEGTQHIGLSRPSVTQGSRRPSHLSPSLPSAQSSTDRRRTLSTLLSAMRSCYIRRPLADEHARIDSPNSHKSSWPSCKSRHTLTRRSCNNGTRVRTFPSTLQRPSRASELSLPQAPPSFSTLFRFLVSLLSRPDPRARNRAQKVV